MRPLPMRRGPWEEVRFEVDNPIHVVTVSLAVEKKSCFEEHETFQLLSPNCQDIKIRPLPPCYSPRKAECPLFRPLSATARSVDLEMRSARVYLQALTYYRYS